MTEWHDWLQVSPSSIVGLGLFSKINIPKDTLLPGCYSGVYLTAPQYSKLVDELDTKCRKPESGTKDDRGVRRSTRQQSRSDEQFVTHLERNYGIRIVSNSDNIPNSDKVAHGDDRAEPNWRAISKGITDYAFEGEDNGNGKHVMVTVLPVYSHNGKPVFDTKYPDNPYMLMNEPPPVPHFTNRFTGLRQDTQVNVTPVLPSELQAAPTSYRSQREWDKHKHALRFRARTNISAGDELFICYGALYERPYQINMDTECGCGQYDQVAGNLAPGVTRRLYNKAVSDLGYIPEDLLSPQSLADPRIVEYFRPF